jgi:hypothetical protein
MSANVVESRHNGGFEPFADIDGCIETLKILAIKLAIVHFINLMYFTDMIRKKYNLLHLITLLITSWYIVFGVGFHFHNSIASVSNYEVAVSQDAVDSVTSLNANTCIVCLLGRTLSMPGHTFLCPILPSNSDYIVPATEHIFYKNVFLTDSGRSPPFYV